MIEQGPKRIEPFLTIVVHGTEESSVAICPETGQICVTPTRSEAESGLYALVSAFSRVIIERAKKGEIEDPEKLALARRIMEVPEERMAEVFVQGEYKPPKLRISVFNPY